MARSTQQVFDHHIAALESADVSEIMADYADDAMVVTLDGAVVGKEAIQGTFEQSLKGFPNLKFTDAQTVVEGDTLLTYWSAESDTATVPQGVDTFIIRDGKIQRHTAWFVVVPKEA